MPRNASGKHAEREVSQNPICVDLCCGIDYVDTLTRLGEWTGDKWGEYEHLNSVWYQRSINLSRRSKSSNGDEGHDLAALVDDGELARKHFADARKQKKKESQNTSIQRSLEEEVREEALVVPEKSPDKSPTSNVAPPEEEQHFSGDLRESRGDDVKGMLNEESTPRDDTEEREQPETNEETTIVSLTHKPTTKAPISILKKSSYQLNVTSPGSESKKKAKKTPKSSATPPGRTPKSTKQYVDTSKRSFWSSKSPKAMSAANFKRQKGWTSSNAAPSDYAMMI